MIGEVDLTREPVVVIPTSALTRHSVLRTLTPAYWRFLSASVFFDFGFGLFFFMFNLYLAAAGFNESRIGLFTGAFTFGSLVATWPVGLVARRYGLRPVLALCMIGAPAAGALRLFALAPAAQLASSFLFGISMCGWAVCTPTALARLTDERNRSLGFSLNFGVGIGTGVLAGVIGGRLPAKLSTLLALSGSAAAMRFTLLLACALATLGALPLTRSSFLAAPEPTPNIEVRSTSSYRRFLLQFLAAFGLWTSIAAAFTPFANIYMVRKLGIALPHVGEIFAASQFLQVLAVISTPLLQRFLGAKKTILGIQLSAAAMLLLLSRTASAPGVIAEFILLNTFLYMAGPIIYSLLMTLTPDPERSVASAAQSITSSLIGAGAAAVAGLIAEHEGYMPLFIFLAVVALGAAVLFSSLHPAELENPR